MAKELPRRFVSWRKLSEIAMPLSLSKNVFENLPSVPLGRFPCHSPSLGIDQPRPFKLCTRRCRPLPYEALLDTYDRRTKCPSRRFHFVAGGISHDTYQGILVLSASRLPISRPGYLPMDARVTLLQSNTLEAVDNLCCSRSCIASQISDPEGIPSYE